MPEVLAPLVAAGLVEKTMSTPVDEAFTVTIHPGVAEGGRADAGPEFQAAVDEELAATWRTVMRRGLETYTKERSAGLMIVRAGLAAFPYLSRLQKWEMAAKMIEEVVQIDTDACNNYGRPALRSPDCRSHRWDRARAAEPQCFG